MSFENPNMIDRQQKRPPEEGPASNNPEQKPKQEERAPYVSISSLARKVQLLGGYTRNIIPEDVLTIINLYQPEIGDTRNSLSTEEWNKTMEAKEKAQQAMATWIEQEVQKNNIAWIGDWSRGERPDGYIKTSERYERLHKAGFSLTTRLGKDWVKEHNLLLLKAKGGILVKDDVDSILKKNKEFNDEMDRFEGEQQYSI